MRLYNGVRLLGQGPSIRNIQKIDSGAIPWIQAACANGMQVDLDHFAKLEQTLISDMDEITEKVHTLTGHYINIDSGDQVADLLFKKLGLKQARIRLTNSGSRESVIDEVLTAIQHEHPVIAHIQDFKELSKLKGTYVIPIQKLARKITAPNCNHYTWRILPNIKNTRVPSGRYACADPNLLAIPSRTKRGQDIRKGFITDEGWTIVSVDESQIEMRLAAHCSGDETLIRAYYNEEDIYSDFAITAFRLEDGRYRDANNAWVYPHVLRMEHRYPAKTCMLASIYDVSGKGLLEQMPVVCANCSLEAKSHTCGNFRPYWTEEKCQDLINAFYIKCPGIVRDRRRYHAMARRYAYVWDMWGRLLHTTAVRSVHPWVVSACLREAGNFPYQSGAQGTIKLTMAENYQDVIITLREVCRPLLQVHDELLFEAREDVAQEIIAITKQEFEHCVELRVPIKASGCNAQSWGHLDK